MRSNFNSFIPVSNSPCIYSLSSPARNSFSSTHTRLDLSSSSLNTTHRDPHNSRDFSVMGALKRDSLPSSSLLSTIRSSNGEYKPIEHVGNSRVTCDDETSLLLEKYGVRKTSCSERSSQSHLRQRRQHQPESDVGFSVDRRKSDTTGIEMGMSGDGLHVSQMLNRKGACKQLNDGIKDITHAEYLNRLLAAHNRVDDLLRSRGLNAEDESKYLRAWEEIPVIKEERCVRARTRSNSSDSGLSTDNESDQSHSEAITNEGSIEQELSRADVNNECIKLFAISCRDTRSFSCRELASQTSSAVFSFSRKSILTSTSKVILSPSSCTEYVKAILNLSTTKNISVSTFLKCKGKSLKTRKNLCFQEFQHLDASINVTKYSPKLQNCQKQGAKFHLPHQRASIKERLESDLKCITKQFSPVEAKESGQVSSFRRLHEEFVEAPVERNVQINVKFQKRTRKKYISEFVLPVTPSYMFAHLNVSLKKKPKNNPGSLGISKPVRAVGKLDRSFSLKLRKDNKPERLVNRLNIPDFFLQLQKGITDDIKIARNNLKKVSRKQSNAVCFKGVPENIVTLQKVQHHESVSQQLPSCLRLSQEDNQASHLNNMTQSHSDRDKVICNSNYSNTLCSVHCTETTGVSKCHEFELAELSHIDRLLVEQFRQSKHIPRPKALRQCASLYVQQQPHDLIQPVDEHPLGPPKVEFVRRRTPLRRPKQTYRHSSPPSLKNTLRKVAPFVERGHFLKYPPLKKIDRTFRKPKVIIKCTKRWKPRWRKNSEEEEVDDARNEEEEEEEEEEEAEQSNSVERNERSKLKTYINDDDDTMTEAEKAMAASRRRQVEEQQNKLQEYDERRRVEREKEEKELKKLKEKQERRKIEREQEEREQAERRKQEEDRRRKEEEDRKAKHEEEKRKKDEEKMRRQQMTFAAFSTAVGQGGRNFVIPKRTDNRNDKFGNIVQAKQEMGMTKEQQEEAKRAFLASVAKGIPISSDLKSCDLKVKIKELHQRICKLEAEKYDLEKRHERQEYDLKELNERQRQVARNNALKKGIDPADAASSKYPKHVASTSTQQKDNVILTDDKGTFNPRKTIKIAAIRYEGQ